MARRHVFAAVLATALVAALGGALEAPPTGRGAPLPPGVASRSSRAALLDASSSATIEAVAAERSEHVVDGARSDQRRRPSRDGRPLDWLAFVALIAAIVATRSSALARCTHRRVAPPAPGLVPLRGPPRLLPS